LDDELILGSESKIEMENTRSVVALETRKGRKNGIRRVGVIPRNGTRMGSGMEAWMLLPPGKKKSMTGKRG